jgi:hypothetical protein
LLLTLFLLDFFTANLLSLQSLSAFTVRLLRGGWPSHLISIPFVATLCGSVATCHPERRARDLGGRGA